MPICKLDCWADINEEWKSIAEDRRWRIDVGSELIDKARSDQSWTSNNQAQLPAPARPTHPVGSSSEIFEEKRPPRTELYWEEKDKAYKRIDHDEKRYSIQDPWANLFSAQLSPRNFR